MQLIEKNDIKIFILYLLRNIGYPLEFSDINDVVLQDGLVNYFDFAECFAELIESKNIEEISGDKEPLYTVTEQGRNVSDSLESELFLMIREKSLKSALRLLNFKRRGSTFKYSWKELPNGKYEFSCKIIELKEPAMDLTITVDNKKMLDRMIYTFEERPETVYRGMLAIMTGEINYLL